MNAITAKERAINLHGIEARAFAVVTAADGRILNQQIGATRYYTEGKRRYRITLELRFDDQCGNGHETFSATADIREEAGGRWMEYMGGCCHEEIAKRFPEVAHLIDWHLCSTDGPLHYVANTVYLAGDRDFNGLRKGEQRQIRNGKTGELAWIRKGAPTAYHDGPTPPADSLTLTWEPWLRTGEGKERELNAARSTAVWPEATDEELCQEPDALRVVLVARLKPLLARFQADMVAAGFEWPQRVTKEVA